jgi:hypothetical protein
MPQGMPRSEVIFCGRSERGEIFDAVIGIGYRKSRSGTSLLVRPQMLGLLDIDTWEPLSPLRPLLPPSHSLCLPSL